MKVVTYLFATMASLCFVSGLIILSDEGDNEYGAA